MHGSTKTTKTSKNDRCLFVWSIDTLYGKLDHIRDGFHGNLLEPQPPVSVCSVQNLQSAIQDPEQRT